MRVVIIGASGLVGSNCEARWKLDPDFQVMGTHFGFATPFTQFYDTLNPANPANADIRAFRPDWIVHCGALTHVDHCEQHPEESWTATVKSTLNLIQVAKETGARMAYFSTDYVFDGATGPYRETDAVKPLNVYGRHKLEAEQAVLAELPDSLVLRITNVYGDEARGKNFIARIVAQLREGKQLTLRLPLDQYATPANAWDIAGALRLLIEHNHKGIWHLAGTDFMNRCQLAQRIGRRFPGQLTIEPVTTAVLQQPAQRPLMGGLLSEKLFTAFPDFYFSTVDDYLDSLGL